MVAVVVVAVVTRTNMLMRETAGRSRSKRKLTTVKIIAPTQPRGVLAVLFDSFSCCRADSGVTLFQVFLDFIRGNYPKSSLTSKK